MHFRWVYSRRQQIMEGGGDEGREVSADEVPGMADPKVLNNPSRAATDPRENIEDHRWRPVTRGKGCLHGDAVQSRGCPGMGFQQDRQIKGHCVTTSSYTNS